MKNIHVLPTEKPSRIIIGDYGNFVFGLMQNSIASKNDSYTNHNIYITSDEEIKNGDWCFYVNGVYKVLRISSNKRPVIKMSDGTFEISYYKKIILTTDQDLIKDGVQAIDDEFLEWFVKNPSCEQVKVNNLCYGALGGFADAGYKIIIPKEFPKPNIIDNWLEKNGDPEIAKQVEQEAKDLCEQETLEEISPMNDLLIDLRETKISVKESIDIIEDEFMRTQINIFIQKTLDSVIDRIENELLETESKWQQEQDKNRYSEEDMKKAYHCGRLYQGREGDTTFEQFIITT